MSWATCSAADPPAPSKTGASLRFRRWERSPGSSLQGQTAAAFPPAPWPARRDPRYWIPFYTEGEILEIGEEAKKEILQKLLEFRKNSGIDISIISVNDIYHNYFLIEDRLLVELGSASYLEQKLQFVPKMNEMMTDDEHNAIDLSGWSPDNNEAVSHEKNIDGYISFK